MRLFKGTLKESHRAFVVSADCVSEGTDEPWSKVPELRPGELQPFSEFALQQNGPVHLVFAFDGRVRQSRREIEDVMVKPTAHVVEGWIIYQANSASSSRKTKEYVLGAANKETFYISLPVARNRLPTKERGDSNFAACGETTTHYSSYTGVPQRALRELPKMSAADKAKIIQDLDPSSMACAPPGTLDEKGVPLFWSEVKPLAFWSELISNFDLGAVYDLTPGSGALATACLQAGTVYFGAVGNEHHLSWLQNVLDRAALVELVTAGTPLYQEDLATSIKEHFSELLDQLNAPDAESEEEVEEGAA